VKSRWSRREFLKKSAALMALGVAGEAPGAAVPPSAALPTRVLGRTGEKISIIGFGAGSRFCTITDEEQAIRLLERAARLGVTYFDTAASYTRRGLERLSERRLGEFAKRRRKEIFLATKFDERDRDGALRAVEQSLKTLQTDFIDLIQIHSLNGIDDLDRMGGPRGAIAAARELKDQKVARFVGITSHNDGAAMAEALRRHDFDVVLMALNAAQSANPYARPQMQPIPAFEGSALPAAVKKQMGIVLVGSGHGRSSGSELLRFNLSQPVASVVIGIDQLETLEEDVRVARAFAPMGEAEKRKLREKVAPSRSAWQRYLESHDDSLPA
jgi:aryl-alcohol dehydrogenase-like predicted oxidoreductase